MNMNCSECLMDREPCQVCRTREQALSKIRRSRAERGIIIGAQGLGVSRAVREAHHRAVDAAWVEYYVTLGQPVPPSLQK